MTKKGAIILEDTRRTRRSGIGLRKKLLAVGIVFFGLCYVGWATGTITERTKIRQARVDISQIQHAVRLFRADNGRCPDSLDELRNPPSNRFYTARVDDPWGRPYRLICPARMDKGGAEVISGGPNRNLAGDDNISSL